MPKKSNLFVFACGMLRKAVTALALRYRLMENGLYTAGRLLLASQ